MSGLRNTPPTHGLIGSFELVFVDYFSLLGFLFQRGNRFKKKSVAEIRPRQLRKFARKQRGATR